MSDEERDYREGWTPEMIEEERLENLTSPLFDMFLEFERKFADKAIDELNVSDEDAERQAAHMGSTDAGRAYAYLLGQIKHARIMRDFCHRFETICAANGGQMPKECMTIAEVHEEYSKVPKGEA